MRRLGHQRAVWRGIAAVIAVVLLSAIAAPVMAQGGGFELPPGVTWDDVNAIARKMYCDVCEGVPLDECESVACRQWREEIARQLGEGRTEGEIIDLFVERYGADVASLPRSTGDRLLAFAVPVLLALVIAIVGGMQVQQMRRKGRQAGQMVRRTTAQLSERPVPDDVDPAYVERLHAELGELEA